MNTGKRIAGIVIALTLGLGVTMLEAQEATERYIPVGQSPGLSGIYTYIGQVVNVDQQGQTMTVEHEGEVRTIRLTSETHIWLDRSLLRERNGTGSISDLQAGRTVEVKYEDQELNERAYWIKVRIQPE